MKLPLLCCTAIVIAISAPAQSPAEKALLNELTQKTGNHRAAVDQILAQSEIASSTLLFLAAGTALKENLTEDAGFFLYAAQLRTQFDLIAFPPKDTGGNSPMVALGALNQTLGSTINPALMADPAAFAHTLERIKTWQPRLAKDFNPGWTQAGPTDLAKADLTFREARTKLLNGMTGLATLLQEPGYFAAFKTVQDFNLHRPTGSVSQSDVVAALKIMTTIETQKGIRGVAANYAPPTHSTYYAKNNDPRLPNLGEATRDAKKITVYAGQSELAAKSESAPTDASAAALVVANHSFEPGPLNLTKVDLDSLNWNFRVSPVFALPGTAKQPGIFHGDYLITWHQDDQPVARVIISLTTHELIAIIGEKTYTTDLTSNGFNNLQRILKKYSGTPPTEPATPPTLPPPPVSPSPRKVEIKL